MGIMLSGIGVSRGVVVGQAVRVDRGHPIIEATRIGPKEVPRELGRLDDGRDRLVADLEKARRRLAQQDAPGIEELVSLIGVQIGFLGNSRLMRMSRTHIEEGLMSAPAAVSASMAQIEEVYAKMTDPYLAARFEDIDALGGRLLDIMLDRDGAIGQLPEHAVLVAHEITPADTAWLEPGQVAAIAAETGGLQGHVAILARALAIPAVLGVHGLLEQVETGDQILVDGAGQVVVQPDADQQAKGKAAAMAFSERLERLRANADEPAYSLDQVYYNLQANIELPQEVPRAVNWGANGIGLLRTEFLFLERRNSPSEEEQTEILSSIVKQLGGRPVTIRTLDVGGEKVLPGYGELDQDAENPALGLRAIRLSLRNEEPFRAQIRAILRASRHGPVRLLFPMVATMLEITHLRGLVEEERARLVDEGLDIAMPPLGIMIEVPAAALSADLLAKHVEFLSLGTNDLTQYTLAIDRTNEKVAHLYDHLNPAVLRLVQFSVAAAERAGIPITICGEMAGDPSLTRLLMGLGLTEFSMVPRSLPEVKEQICQSNRSQLMAEVAMLMAEGNREAIAGFVGNNELGLNGTNKS